MKLELAAGEFWPVDLTSDDYARMTDLVVRRGDLPLGTTDASVVAVAEGLKIDEVATLGRRHFSVVRPNYVGALKLLP
jgi:hypothetical protein